MKKLGIGMIGYGAIARVHAMAYRTIPMHYGLPADTITIAGVAGRSAEAAQKSALELGCPFWTADYHDLLARSDIDVIDCSLPNHLHEEVVLAAAKAGKHIYCEKPLAMDVTQGRRMVDAANQAGVKTQMNFNFRFYPAVMRARQLIDDGFLGRVFSFRGCFYRASYINPNKPLSWRLKKESAGSGALFDLGSHIIDLVYYLLGDFNSVLATLDTLIKERPVSAGSTQKGRVDVDDIALMQVRMANDALGTIEASRMGTGVVNDVRLEIFGEKGALRFNLDDPNWLEVFDVNDKSEPLGGLSGFKRIQTVGHYAGQKAPDWSMPPGFVRTFAEGQYQFLKAISENLQTSPSLAEGLYIQSVMEAALTSSTRKSWVNVTDID